MISTILFFGELVLIYFITKQITNELFFVIRKITKSHQLSLRIITFIYLPGTIIHELSHYIAALFLHLRIKDISIFPEFEGNYIKLGSVRYIKADFFRGFLVGIAPLIVGIIIFYIIFFFNLFPLQNFILNIPFAYLLFIIAITMFSSKQDMIDAIYLIPIIIIFGIIIYIFNIDFTILFKNEHFRTITLGFITNVQRYFLIVLCICIGLFCSLKLTNKFLLK